MRAHADAHQGNLADAVVAYDLARGKPLPGLALEHVERLLVLSSINGERKVGVTRSTDVLHDHVHVDVGSGNGPEDRIGDAGTVFDPHERNFRLVAVEGMPEMMACSMVSSSSNVMSVPGEVLAGSSNDDSTRSFTLYLPANSTERNCRTLEPKLAISSISSKVTRSSLRASGTMRGSVV